MAYFDEKQREMLEGILGLGGIDSDEVQRIIIAAEENNTPITRVFDRVFTNSVESRDSYFKNAIFPDKPFIKSTTAADEEARGKEIGA